MAAVGTAVAAAGTNAERTAMAIGTGMTTMAVTKMAATETGALSPGRIRGGLAASQTGTAVIGMAATAQAQKAGP